MSLDVELDSVRVPLGLGFDEQQRSMNVSKKGTSNSTYHEPKVNRILREVTTSLDLSEV